MDGQTRNKFAILMGGEDEEAVPAPTAAPAKETPAKKETQAKETHPKRDALPKSETHPKRDAQAKTPLPKRDAQQKTPLPKRDTPPAQKNTEEPQGTTAAAHKKHPATRPNRGRPFDRRSAAAPVTHGEKKIVAGKASWGDAVTEQVKLADEGLPLESTDSVPPAATQPEPELPDPEDSFLTVDQFLAQKKPPVSLFPTTTATPRLPNEGVDPSQWSNQTKLDHSLQEELFANLKKQSSSSSRKQKEKPQKSLLNIEQTFTAPPAQRERDQRQGPRQGPRNPQNSSSRGRPPRSSRPSTRPASQRPINVNDQAAFPSLGAN